MNFFQKLKKWGYPECEHLNLALRYLLKNPRQNQFAIKEIYFALTKTHGYFYDDVAKLLYDEFKFQAGKEATDVGKDNNVPTKEPLTCTGCQYLDEQCAPCASCIRARRYKDYYRRQPEGEA